MTDEKSARQAAKPEASAEQYKPATEEYTPPLAAEQSVPGPWHSPRHGQRFRPLPVGVRARCQG